MRSALSLAVLALLAAAPTSAKTLNIVATVPELVEMTQRLGGDRVKVDGLARGTEDIHQIVMRPSFVSKLNRADAVVYLGMTVEHSFLPALLDVAANPRLRADFAHTCSGPGCIDCSAGLRVLDRPETVSRAEGELHPQGNPHYNLDPEEGARIAKNIAAGLSRIAPSDAVEFEKNLKAYSEELTATAAELRALAAPLKGVKAVSFHKDVAYLGRFTGIDFVGTLELKPGIAPTPTHLAKLVKEMKEKDVRLIVREQQYEAKTCQWLAEQTGARIAVIGTMAKSLPGTESFLQLSERNVKALLEAAGKR